MTTQPLRLRPRRVLGAGGKTFRIDMSPVRNDSLWLHRVLLARTIPAVLKKMGAY